MALMNGFMQWGVFLFADCINFRSCIQQHFRGFDVSPNGNHMEWGVSEQAANVRTVDVDSHKIRELCSTEFLQNIGESE